MLAFPSMLIAAAEEAGMKVPTLTPFDEDFDSNEFPHFHVFCAIQLHRPMHDMAEHWENAKVIAEVPDEDIKTITIDGLLARGLSWTS